MEAEPGPPARCGAALWPIPHSQSKNQGKNRKSRNDLGWYSLRFGGKGLLLGGVGEYNAGMGTVLTARLNVKATPAEMERWHVLARSRGGLSLSELVRKMLDDACGHGVVEEFVRKLEVRVPAEVVIEQDQVIEVGLAETPPSPPVPLPEVLPPVDPFAGLPREPIDCKDPRLCSRCAREIRVHGRKRVKGCVDCKFG